MRCCFLCLLSSCIFCHVVFPSIASQSVLIAGPLMRKDSDIASRSMNSEMTLWFAFSISGNKRKAIHAANETSSAILRNTAESLKIS